MQHLPHHREFGEPLHILARNDGGVEIVAPQDPEHENGQPHDEGDQVVHASLGENGRRCLHAGFVDQLVVGEVGGAGDLGLRSLLEQVGVGGVDELEFAFDPEQGALGGRQGVDVGIDEGKLFWLPSAI